MIIEVNYKIDILVRGTCTTVLWHSAKWHPSNDRVNRKNNVVL